MPDVFAAVRDYVADRAFPPIDPDRIFRGWRHKDALPGRSGDDADFAVLTILSDTRRGTNVSGFTTDAATRDDGTLTRSKLVVCEVLAEFYGDADLSRRRACAVETAFRDEIATRFLAGRDVTPLYADAAREVTPAEHRRDIPPRYAVTLRLSYWMSLSARADWFDNANVHFLVEVDTHYPMED